METSDDGATAIEILWSGSPPFVFSPAGDVGVYLGALVLPPLIRVPPGGDPAFGQLPERATPLVEDGTGWVTLSNAIVDLAAGVLSDIPGPSSLSAILCDENGAPSGDFLLQPPQCPHDITEGVRVQWNEIEGVLDVDVEPPQNVDAAAILRVELPATLDTLVPPAGLDGYSIGVEAALNTRADLDIVNTLAWDVIVTDWLPRVGLGDASGPTIWLSGRGTPSNQGYACALDFTKGGVREDTRKTVLGTLTFDLDDLGIEDIAGATHLYLRLSDARHARGAALIGRVYLLHRARAER